MTVKPHLEVVCSLLVGESAANDVIACQLLILSTCLEVSLHSQALLAKLIESRYQLHRCQPQAACNKLMVYIRSQTAGH